MHLVSDSPYQQATMARWPLGQAAERGGWLPLPSCVSCLPSSLCCSVPIVNVGKLWEVKRVARSAPQRAWYTVRTQQCNLAWFLTLQTQFSSLSLLAGKKFSLAHNPFTCSVDHIPFYLFEDQKYKDSCSLRYLQSSLPASSLFLEHA